MQRALISAENALDVALVDLADSFNAGEIDSDTYRAAAKADRAAHESDVAARHVTLLPAAQAAVERANRSKRLALRTIADAVGRAPALACNLVTFFSGDSTTASVFDCDAAVRRVVLAFPHRESTSGATLFVNGQVAGTAPSCKPFRHRQRREPWLVSCSVRIPVGSGNGIEVSVKKPVPVGSTVVANAYGTRGKWGFEKSKVFACYEENRPMGLEGTVLLEYGCQKRIDRMSFAFATPVSSTWTVDTGGFPIASGTCAGGGTATVTCTLSPALGGPPATAEIHITPQCNSGATYRETFFSGTARYTRELVCP